MLVANQTVQCRNARSLRRPTLELVKCVDETPPEATEIDRRSIPFWHPSMGPARIDGSDEAKRPRGELSAARESRTKGQAAWTRIPSTSEIKVATWRLQA